MMPHDFAVLVAYETKVVVQVVLDSFKSRSFCKNREKIFNLWGSDSPKLAALKPEVCKSLICRVKPPSDTP